MKARFIHQLLLLAWLAIFVQNAPAAVSLTVTPSAVSNTYNGNLTLVIAGLPGSGQTVVVQKFLDANTNGVIDAGDLMIQQFTVTDGNGGMIIGGVTNNNVPGDTDSVAQQITAKLNFQSDWLQTFAGNYLFKISSPSNTFTGLTNSFIVTNFNYAAKISAPCSAIPRRCRTPSSFCFPRAGNMTIRWEARLPTTPARIRLPAPAGATPWWR